MKVFIQTFGCQMNLADSEEMFLHLSARGAVLTEDMDNADVVLINTCTVRDHAEHRAVSFLGRLAAWKKQDPKRIIIFAGCAAQRLGKKLQKQFPFLDICAGAKSIGHFSDILDNSGLFPTVSQEGIAPKQGLTGYVTIMRGCDFACSYCIVPTVRGKIICLSPQDILKDVQRKVQAGAKEIMLLGQTVNAYRHDDISFSKLLNLVSEVEGVERVRFTSPHPIYVTDEFLTTLKNNPKIARHMHLPVQSGSSKVLQEMKRGYTREIFLEKIRALHDCGMSVSTDIIVGFPTETQEDFEQTLTLVDEAQFMAAFCYKYSPREGTPAALMKLHEEKVLEERLDILLNKVRGLSEKAYIRQVGSTQEVLLEESNKGRSSGNFWVKTNKNYPIGSIIKVDIEKSEGTLLFAKEL